MGYHLTSVKLVIIWNCLYIDLLAFNGLANGYLLCKSLEWVSPFKLLKLTGRVSRQELVDTHIATADSDQKLAFSFAHFNAFGSKLVDSGALAEEHNLQLLTIWVVIEEFCHSFIYRIVLNRNIDGNFGLEIDCIYLELLNLCLLVPYLLQ